MADSLVPVLEAQEKMDTDKMWVIWGPQHPFSHGLWTLKLKIDGEFCVDADPIVGYLHRGWEKETENRDYARIIPMTDRLCYCASMTYSHLYCMTVEKALGIDIPEKAKYIRIVADEICRIQSHLMWLAAVGTDMGNLTVFLWAMREREYFLDLNVKLCGARMTTNYPRIGGVRNDTTEVFERDLIRTIDRFEKAMWDIIYLIDDSSVFVSRMRKISYLTREQCANMGLTGPAMRGCGVDFDIRRDDPYRSEEHTSELQSHHDLGCRLLLEKKAGVPEDPGDRKERTLQAQDTYEGPCRNDIRKARGSSWRVHYVPRIRRYGQTLEA